MPSFPRRAGILFFLLLASSVTQVGCILPSLRNELPEIAASDIPRELMKVTLPEYRVEPPDILIIQAITNIRPSNDKLRAGDQLEVRVMNTIPVDPEDDPLSVEFKQINAVFQIQTNGTIDLGPVYGSVKVADLTMDEAKEAVQKHLKEVSGLLNPKIAFAMTDMAGRQPITGEHLVRPDGTVSLGVYGSVFVTGMTLDEVKVVIEAHLTEYMHRPEVQVDVAAYNSKKIYVITDRAGSGEQIIPLPFTGNETVLDAVAQIQGLSDVSSKKIWVARPAPDGLGRAQTMIVDWRGITQDGITTTNYQVFPGDRIYIQGDHFVAFDTFVSRVTSPFERIYGHILLGHGLVRELQFGHIRGGNARGGGGGGF